MSEPDLNCRHCGRELELTAESNHTLSRPRRCKCGGVIPHFTAPAE